MDYSIYWDKDECSEVQQGLVALVPRFLTIQETDAASMIASLKCLNFHSHSCLFQIFFVHL